ncbi:MAG: hypothetical protein GY870_02690 [archaeon]|nr:hypothetical protein [archaeon]
MELTKKTNLSIMKSLGKKLSIQRLKRKKLCVDIERRMDEAIESGDFDKVLECMVLRDRL